MCLIKISLFWTLSSVYITIIVAVVVVVIVVVVVAVVKHSTLKKGLSLPPGVRCQKKIPILPALED
jgi:heme/copper-type cytochrome/quinol oxidase subunit 2